MLRITELKGLGRRSDDDNIDSFGLRIPLTCEAIRLNTLGISADSTIVFRITVILACVSISKSLLYMHVTPCINADERPFSNTVAQYFHAVFDAWGAQFPFQSGSCGALFCFVFLDESPVCHGSEGSFLTDSASFSVADPGVDSRGMAIGYMVF